MIVARRVWIEAGCVRCQWCSDLSPEVFVAGSGSSLVRADARADGVTDENPRRAALRLPLDEQAAEFLAFVADGCPARVIRLDGG